LIVRFAVKCESGPLALGLELDIGQLDFLWLLTDEGQLLAGQNCGIILSLLTHLFVLVWAFDLRRFIIVIRGSHHLFDLRDYRNLRRHRRFKDLGRLRLLDR